MKKILLVLILSSNLFCKENDEPEEFQIKEGILSLSSSQQISPLFSFGQNIVEKNDILFTGYANYFREEKRKKSEIIPTLLYGITDSFSIFILVPFAISFKSDKRNTSGLEDIGVQFEYAFHNKTKITSTEQVSIIAGINLPTGSASQNPALGLGSSSLFLGTAATRIGIEWYIFASLGSLITFKHKNKQQGNSFYYQFGVGKDIADAPELVFCFMAEFLGTYTQKNKINCITDPNSGGNVIFIAPSLWLGSEKFIFQAGVAIPIVQHLFGIQQKFDYIASVSFTWNFT